MSKVDKPKVSFNQPIHLVEVDEMPTILKPGTAYHNLADDTKLLVLADGSTFDLEGGGGGGRHPGYRPGGIVYPGNPFAGPGTVTQFVGPGYMWWSPIYIAKTGISMIGVGTTGFQATKTGRIGIYEVKDDGNPGALLETIAIDMGVASGLLLAEVTGDFEEGWYWSGFGTNANVQVYACSSQEEFEILGRSEGSFTATNKHNLYTDQVYTGTLPDPAPTTLTPSTSYQPLIYVKGS